MFNMPIVEYQARAIVGNLPIPLDNYAAIDIAACHADYKWQVISDEIDRGERGYYPPVVHAYLDFSILAHQVAMIGRGAGAKEAT